MRWVSMSAGTISPVFRSTFLSNSYISFVFWSIIYLPSMFALTDVRYHITFLIDRSKRCVMADYPACFTPQTKCLVILVL